MRHGRRIIETTGREYIPPSYQRSSGPLPVPVNGRGGGGGGAIPPRPGSGLVPFRGGGGGGAIVPRAGGRSGIFRGHGRKLAAAGVGALAVAAVTRRNKRTSADGMGSGRGVYPGDLSGVGMYRYGGM